MKINNVEYDINIEMPSLEKAKELTSFNKGVRMGNILVLVPVVPSVTPNGITVSESVHKEVQKVINEEGMLVVDVCPSLEKNIQVQGIKPGMFVKVGPSQNTDVKLVKDEEGNKFLTCVLHFTCIFSFVDTPKYDLEKEITTKKNHDLSNGSNLIM
ncbi:MAG: hypothetical protein CMC35_02980 [Flavobacteriaceae bacterium]|nr:hypothetical protein [Flavobacteriaceae bacterium]|tara:strand:- start:1291 stop:1758 length:468 start_codon:yes stop_codon:yes gene_type:complete